MDENQRCLHRDSTSLRQASEEHKKNMIPISTQTTTISSGISFGTVDQLDPSFMYTQIFKEILQSIKFEQKHFLEFTEYCRGLLVENRRELTVIDEFEKTYSADRAH